MTPGWTKTIRAPVSYTNALKIKQMVLYEETGSPSEYEEDHFIPLELGGAPRNPKNLWPEPHSQSKLSDPLETQLKRKVCKHLMTQRSNSPSQEHKRLEDLSVLTSQTAYDVLTWPCIRSRPKARKPPTRSCARGEEPRRRRLTAGPALTGSSGVQAGSVPG
jgi:hypothetical protein